MIVHRLSNNFLIRLLCSVAFISSVYLVLKPFLNSIAWALVITVCAWPINIFLRKLFRKHAELISALIITLSLSVVFFAILIPFSLELVAEAKHFTALARAQIEDEATITAAIGRLPLLGNLLGDKLIHTNEIKSEGLQFLNEHQSQLISAISIAARGMWRFLFGVGVTFFTCFYLFRYGDMLATQLLSVAKKYGGISYVQFIQISWNTIGAVLYGVVVAAIMQGLLAGIGFYLFGAPMPLLFGVITVILGLIPFGPPILYIPMAIYLYSINTAWYLVIGLLIWSIGIVSTADNIFRPLFISRSTKMPVLLAFFGGLGGIAAFGMIGLFVGPVLLALLQTIWSQQVLLSNSEKDHPSLNL
jgi:P-type Ca2+ transporter type 2C